mmetsp:Transcript_28788/g.79047  ORF Transcript_28788/g.79047 Transcript_28788/m.79047 type:complete len:168 (-) Transcript_28788:155-658(-)
MILWPNPVHPNGTTAAEIYSVDFSAEERHTGREQYFYVPIQHLLASDEPSLIIVDTNDLILEGDTNCPYRDIHHCFQEKFKLCRLLFDFLVEDELVPYVDATDCHAFVTHRPLSLACDARTFISMESRVLRSFSAAILTNVVRICENKPLLQPTQEYENPINGCLSF